MRERDAVEVALPQISVMGSKKLEAYGREVLRVLNLEPTEPLLRPQRPWHCQLSKAGLLPLGIAFSVQHRPLTCPSIAT